MTSYYNSFRLSYLVTVCYSVSKLGYLYIGELPVLSEDFTFLKSMAKIVQTLFRGSFMSGPFHSMFFSG